MYKKKSEIKFTSLFLTQFTREIYYIENLFLCSALSIPSAIILILRSSSTILFIFADYFREISEAFHDGEIEVDSDAEAIKLSNWEENTYWSK